VRQGKDDERARGRERDEEREKILGILRRNREDTTLSFFHVSMRTFSMHASSHRGDEWPCV
jgi:hypothetical protein